MRHLLEFKSKSIKDRAFCNKKKLSLCNILNFIKLIRTVQVIYKSNISELVLRRPFVVRIQKAFQLYFANISENRIYMGCTCNQNHVDKCRYSLICPLFGKGNVNFGSVTTRKNIYMQLFVTLKSSGVCTDTILFLFHDSLYSIAF